MSEPNLLYTIGPIIIYLLLLIMALGFLVTFYTCTDSNCYINNKTKDLPDPEKFNKKVMMIMAEGAWMIPFVFASIITFVLFAITKGLLPLTPRGYLPVKEFAIIFVISFLTLYGIISFVSHHKVKPIKEKITNIYNKQYEEKIKNN